jgi:GAF domain-containing protein
VSVPEQDLPRTGVHEQLQSLLLSTTDVTDFLQQLTVLSIQVVTIAPVSCGITMRYDANTITVASSDERANALDETQYRNHAGPCLEAMQTGQLVLSQDSRIEQRWPPYIATAVRQGLRCSMSVPLGAAELTFGAMNIYGFDRPNLFGEAEQRQFQLFAAQASGALRLATRQVRDAALLNQLEEALNSRSVIDQAIGILIGRHHVTAAEAFDLLRRQSQNSHRKLRDIATDLVTQASGQPPTPGRTFDPS